MTCRWIARVLLAVLLAALGPGCALRREAPPPAPQKVPTAPEVRQRETGGAQIGIASWYGPGFHGKKTASGEIFDSSKLTAAHRTLPFGTKVLVTNLENGKSVVVTINDRGPVAKARIIDLSRAAAGQIGIGAENGVAKVKVTPTPDAR